MSDVFTFPFSSISNHDLIDNFNLQKVSNPIDSNNLRELLLNSISEETINSLDFDYYSTHQINSLFAKNKHILELSVFHVNIRSLNANYNKLLEFLHCLNCVFDAIILTEVWSNLQYYSNLFNDYEFFSDPPLSKAGGVVMYVKKQLKPRYLSDLKTVPASNSISTCENIWVEINVGKSKYFLAGYYRHPGTSAADFIDALSITLDKLKNSNKVYFFGDLNLDLMKYDIDNNVTKYINELLNFNFLPYVLLPTRITSTSATILDHVFSNNYNDSKYSHKTGLLCSDISDHMANFLFLTAENRKSRDGTSMTNDSNENKIYKRSFSEANIRSFCYSLNNVDWSILYEKEDVDSVYNIFESVISSCYNDSFTIIKCKSKSKDKIWLTQSLIKSINTKCILYKKWAKSKKVKDENKYKEFSRELKAKLRKAEKNYYYKLFDNKVNNTKLIWKNLNKVFNKVSNKETIIDEIIVNDSVIKEPSDICNHFNEYFCNVGFNLAKNSVNRPNDFKNYLNSTVANSFFCSDISMEELKSTLLSLKSSKSSVGDSLSSFLLKQCSDYLCEPLLYICNLSFSKGVFPTKLKASKVVPIFKKGSKSLMSNYRPISITSPFSKVLEKLMHSRLISFLDKFQILYEYQFGFRKHFSTTLALTDVVNMIQNETYNKNYVLAVFMDLQKAFDTLNLEILIEKLQYYGIRGVPLLWFKSFLQNRTQFTFVNGISSTPIETKCGVPQGTVLGPLMFIMYINDIAKIVNKSSLKLFADDSNLFVVANNINSLFEYANEELGLISDWLSANKLYVNYEKTNYMIFQPGKYNQNLVCSHNKLMFNNHVLERIFVTKYLGVLIDDQLLWTEHIKNLVNKIGSVIGIIYRNNDLLPLHCKKSIYFALVHSNLLYCVEVYGNTSKSNLSPLVTKCNSLLRVLQSMPRKTRVSDLYSAFNTLPVNLLFQLCTLKLIHRCRYDYENVPLVINQLFTTGSSIHQHNTRTNNNFALRNRLNPNSISFYGPSLWNKLPSTLQNCSSLYLFVKYLKLYLLESL